MRILFCNFEYPPLGGGGGIVNAWLAAELAKRHEVTVLTSQGFDLPRDAVENGVRVVRVPVYFRTQRAVASLRSMVMYVPMGIRAGRRLIEGDRFDLINTHFVVPSGPVGAALARFGKIPNVLSIHGGDLYDPTKITSPHRYWLLRRLIRGWLLRADAVVGQSANTLNNMQRYFAPEIEGGRIPLGIPRPKAGAEARKRYGLCEEDVLLVTVGRLVARKGLDQLIAMMHRFRADRVRLLILGVGPLERTLKEMAAEKGLIEKVMFMGNVTDADKFGILQMCDLYVSTSQHEGFGLCFLEAMASGLPIVCYDYGGQTDFLSSGRNGVVVPLNALESFGDGCRTLIQDAELRRSFGKTNRLEVENYFIDRCAAQYESVFAEVIDRGLNRSIGGRRAPAMISMKTGAVQ